MIVEIKCENLVVWVIPVEPSSPRRKAGFDWFLRSFFFFFSFCKIIGCVAKQLCRSKCEGGILVPKWILNAIRLFCLRLAISNQLPFLPCCSLMLFTVGLCGLRSALCYICLLRTETSSSFCHPPLLPSSFLSWTFSPSPSFRCSFPLTSICLLFFLRRFRSVHLVSKLIPPSELCERAQEHKTWLWPDVRIISCIIQIIR